MSILTPVDSVRPPSDGGGRFANRALGAATVADTYRWARHPVEYCKSLEENQEALTADPQYCDWDAAYKWALGLIGGLTTALVATQMEFVMEKSTPAMETLRNTVTLVLYQNWNTVFGPDAMRCEGANLLGNVVRRKLSKWTGGRMAVECHQVMKMKEDIHEMVFNSVVALATGFAETRSRNSYLVRTTKALSKLPLQIASYLRAKGCEYKITLFNSEEKCAAVARAKAAHAEELKAAEEAVEDAKAKLKATKKNLQAVRQKLLL